MMKERTQCRVWQECMAQSRKRRLTTGRTSATDSHPVRSQSASAPLPADPAVQGNLDGLAERCYAIAEALNERAELSLAVPFYRQAVTLLLAQRQRDLQEAAALHKGDADLLQELDPGGAPACVEPGAAVGLPRDLEAHLRALGDDLTIANAVTVRQVLHDLLAGLPQPDPQLLALLAKTHVLEGELALALPFFQAALELDPEDVRLAVNCGGALLACGDHAEALRLLRPLARQAGTIDDPAVLRVVLVNLTAAELEAGNVRDAARWRAELVGLSPDDVPVDDWVEDARSWLEAGWREEAKGLLIALRALYPRHVPLLQLLAETFEGCGEFRDAALVYRDLLRPSLGGP